MRMTLSLTVIMIEATQQVTFGVPIMVSVVVGSLYQSVNKFAVVFLFVFFGCFHVLRAGDVCRWEGMCACVGGRCACVRERGCVHV